MDGRSVSLDEAIPLLPRLQILRRLLDDGAYHSGEHLAGELGVTRAAVWKLLDRLRQYGYGIEAVPHRGYRLVSVPDLPLPWEVALRLGEPDDTARPIYFYPSVSSTNDVARDLAERRGVPAGTLVIADRQTSGRGRRGRAWHSPPGGIYLSLVARPRCHPRYAPVIALASALAVARAVEALHGLRAAIKWPNDVLVDDRKLCGVLTEVSADQEAIRWAVIGIGINVAARPDDTWPMGALPPVSLSELGHRVDRPALIARVVRELGALLARLQADPQPASTEVTRAVEQRLAWRGRLVRVETGSTIIEGHLVGVDDSGALVVRDPSGRTLELVAGDVSLRSSTGQEAAISGASQGG